MPDRAAPSPAPPVLKRATLVDVAAHAGTSTISVSRALRRPAMVSEGLRARIMQAVQELGYVSDTAASALASRRSGVIGVLIPSVADAVFGDLLDGLYDAVAATPYTLQLGNTRSDAATEERLIRIHLGQRPAGLILAGIDQSSAARAALERAECPVVQIMDLTENPVDMQVGFSHHAAARTATGHLLARGYHAPAFIGARIDPRTERRLAGYREAMAEAGLAHRARVVTTPKPSSVGMGSTLFRRLRQYAPDADAVLCNDDDLALGALFAAQRAGLSVGREIGICGFNDLDVMAAAFPALTSVRTPRREIGAAALSMIATRLWDGDVAPPIRDLGFKLMVRASTERV
ncbi:LacI family DNA-binding transcriptional regulator [Citreimonas salinaria]|nr:LacI family DNA-binding transcriptional regulator [Citreimonas salinaria]